MVPQPPSFGAKNVTSWRQGSNWAFRYLDGRFSNILVCSKLNSHPTYFETNCHSKWEFIKRSDGQGEVSCQGGAASTARVKIMSAVNWNNNFTQFFILNCQGGAATLRRCWPQWDGQLPWEIWLWHIHSQKGSNLAHHCLGKVTNKHKRYRQTIDFKLTVLTFSLWWYVGWAKYRRL